MDCAKRSCDTEAAASGLPDDPLVEILSRVPAKSLCRFKCVSKGWRDLITDPLHRKKLPQTLEGFFFMFEQECESDSGDDCDSDDGDGEECSTDGSDGERSFLMVDQEHCESHSGDDCDSDDGDGEDCSADGSDGEELPCQQVYGFVDVLATSVRPVDFSFLTELGSIKKSMLLHSCNGLLLFLVDCNSNISESYIVCNPATKQYVSVPIAPDSGRRKDVAYLLYDPSASSHFHLVQFWKMGHRPVVYSSEIQAWSPNECDWDYRYQIIALDSPIAYVNGMLHLILDSRKHQLAAIDVEGNIQNIFPLPCQARAGWAKVLFSDYIGQSQGCLHYIYDDQNMSSSPRKQISKRLVIWVLQDYDKQQWVLKGTVNFLKLFGKMNCHQSLSGHSVVGIHPDHNLVFLVQHWDGKLISYHMDNKEVRDLCTLEPGYKCIAPYVPCFSDFGA